MSIQENIHADVLPAIGADLAGGKLVTLYMLAGVEFALIDLGAGAEIQGAWGEYGQDVETTHGDGEKNTRAMAEAGSTIAIQALEAGAFIPSALECHLLMHTKETGVIEDLREDRFYWSSSQYSAHYAFIMSFEGGWQFFNGKVNERPARLLRKIPVIR
ncbi:hypothetical protein EQ836_07810 [Ectopseudomonas mendocina]|uniref:DUF1566 domain-containing protein n=1 Tax=Ectopseudomonas mendocina TaxID=300 RepID=A0ABD7S036_ECTME|nr:hypothetical protein [Pseudomonas mendocina]TRO14369.1 hypothetical protein EQ829_10205 [Pseudomonas mendocina]TRO19420.1 hypothetical protein EQ836_07810 [Pseudomonas mendocina]